MAAGVAVPPRQGGDRDLAGCAFNFPAGAKGRDPFQAPNQGIGVPNRNRRSGRPIRRMLSDGPNGGVPSVRVSNQVGPDHIVERVGQKVMKNEVGGVHGLVGQCFVLV